MVLVNRTPGALRRAAAFAHNLGRASKREQGRSRLGMVPC